MGGTGSELRGAAVVNGICLAGGISECKIRKQNVKYGKADDILETFFDHPR